MTRTHRIVRSGCFAAVALSLITLSAATPTENWPGFRGPNANGVADAPDVPLTWSKTDNVTWSIDIPGRGWSSPIIWNNVVYLTSAISGKLFKQPSPGLYGAG